MIPILFAHKKSNYYKLKSVYDLDIYDKKRNARSYKGSDPVICHPPCRAWGRLRYFAKPEPNEKNHAFFSIRKVRQNGGVLEHPAYSSLWKAARLPIGKEVDKYGGFTILVNQHWFGHKAEKKTFLYIVGIKPDSIPDYTINFNRIDHTISTSKKYNGKKEVAKIDRELTTIEFDEWLIKIALLIKRNKHEIYTN